MLFSAQLSLRETQTTSSKTWTSVTDSISNDDTRYVKSASKSRKYNNVDPVV